jgi:hypothetical protein
MAPNQPNKAGPLTVWGGILLALLLLNGFGAIAGGIGVMRDALPFPDVWLQDTPFHSYFFPALILFLAVGGSHLAAAYRDTPASLAHQERGSICGIRSDGLDDRRTSADWFSGTDPSVVPESRPARTRVVLCTAAPLLEQRGRRRAAELQKYDGVAGISLRDSGQRCV